MHSEYGLLKTLKGVDLVRLEAVHGMLMERDVLASADAALRVFGPFISDANSEIGMTYGAAKLRASLHITDLSQKASSISDFAGRMHLDKLAELIPSANHTHFERSTREALFYTLALVAGEVWAPHSGDVDLNARLGDDCPEGYFPSAAKCRELVGPLAVPVALAHKLWAWGRVAEVVPLHVVASAEVAPTTWAALVAFREANPRTAWTVEQKIVLSNEFTKRSNAPGAKGVAAAMAAELPGNIGKRLSVKRFNELKAAKSNAGKRALTRQRAA